ncbi:unnamed protein product [Cylicocyclus nassatus]|uniref:Uncharacterized protein n=1 Tax=Cylicocyclus nassatus TaxID=53992 RepID=A0AA36H0L2_CYLNA|nr:unnamed protein product [Cylicocyclus nassatus]
MCSRVKIVVYRKNAKDACKELLVPEKQFLLGGSVSIGEGNAGAILQGDCDVVLRRGRKVRTFFSESSCKIYQKKQYCRNRPKSNETLSGSPERATGFQ